MATRGAFVLKTQQLNDPEPDKTGIPRSFVAEGRNPSQERDPPATFRLVTARRNDRSARLLSGSTWR